MRAGYLTSQKRSTDVGALYSAIDDPEERAMAVWNWAPGEARTMPGLRVLVVLLHPGELNRTVILGKIGKKFGIKKDTGSPGPA